MKKIIIILSIFLINNLAFADRSDFKDGSEPDGFRGIKWGADFATVEKDMQYVRTDTSYDNSEGIEIKVYTRKDDKLLIGKAQLESIEYYFWKDKFYSVKIFPKNLENWLNLKEVTLKKFGTGFSANDASAEAYLWEGDVTFVHLFYNKKSPKWELELRSIKIDNEIQMIKDQEWLKQIGKQKAEKEVEIRKQKIKEEVEKAKKEAEEGW